MSSGIQNKQQFKAAWLYYMNNMKQSEIAEQLEISRASVALYLMQARETGMVRITMESDIFREQVLAQELNESLAWKQPTY